MSFSYLMGIDVGVSFIKTGIYDTSGKLVSMSVIENPGEYPEQGVFLQKSKKMFDITVKSIKEAVKKSGIDNISIEAIGFSGAMGGLMGVDKNWEPVAEWTIISDTRFYPYATDLISKYGKKILKYSGTNFPVFAPKILWWKAEYPEIYKNISKVMGCYGYILGKLGNLKIEEAFIDRTITMFSGFADVLNASWSEELCGLLDIDKKILPRIVDPCTVIAKLDKNIASECGLKPGIPLVAGAGDKAVGNLGAGIVTPGLLIDEVATYGAFSVCVDKFVPDIENRTLENLPSPVSGLYTSGFYLIGSGSISAWFVDTFAQEEKKFADDRKTSVFKILDENSKYLPAGSDGLFSISLLLGRGYPADPDIKGLWIGHTMVHKKEHFYKSLLEGFAYEYGYVFNVMKKTYPWLNLDEVIVMGGGAKSDLYNQIKCDVLGIPFTKLDRDDCALLGAVLIAGNAVGIFPDLKETAKKFLVKGKKYYPDEKNHNIYKKYTSLNTDIFNRTRETFIDLKKINKNVD